MAVAQLPAVPGKSSLEPGEMTTVPVTSLPLYSEKKRGFIPDRALVVVQPDLRHPGLAVRARVSTGWREPGIVRVVEGLVQVQAQGNAGGRRRHMLNLGAVE